MIKFPVKVAENNITITDAANEFICLVAPHTGYAPVIVAILNAHARLQADNAALLDWLGEAKANMDIRQFSGAHQKLTERLLEYEEEGGEHPGAALLAKMERLRTAAKGAFVHYKKDCGEWLPGGALDRGMDALQPGDLD